MWVFLKSVTQFAWSTVLVHLMQSAGIHYAGMKTSQGLKGSLRQEAQVWDVFVVSDMCTTVSSAGRGFVSRAEAQQRGRGLSQVHDFLKFTKLLLKLHEGLFTNNTQSVHQIKLTYSQHQYKASKILWSNFLIVSKCKQKKPQNNIFLFMCGSRVWKHTTI